MENSAKKLEHIKERTEASKKIYEPLFSQLNVIADETNEANINKFVLDGDLPVSIWNAYPDSENI